MHWGCLRRDEMKTLVISFLVLITAILTSCDMRSGIAKKEMEKYDLAPTPTFAPQPTGTPIDPMDIVQVDVYQEGDAISFDGIKLNKTAACTKYNRVKVNGDENVITVKGACRQIMINGDRNKVTADGSAEY